MMLKHFDKVEAFINMLTDSNILVSGIVVKCMVLVNYTIPVKS